MQNELTLMSCLNMRCCMHCVQCAVFQLAGHNECTQQSTISICRGPCTLCPLYQVHLFNTAHNFSVSPYTEEYGCSSIYKHADTLKCFWTNPGDDDDARCGFSRISQRLAPLRHIDPCTTEECKKCHNKQKKHAFSSCSTSENTLPGRSQITTIRLT